MLDGRHMGAFAIAQVLWDLAKARTHNVYTA